VGNRLGKVRRCLCPEAQLFNIFGSEVYGSTAPSISCNKESKEVGGGSSLTLTIAANMPEETCKHPCLKIDARNKISIKKIQIGPW
jgi:hypothetical protein